MQVLSRLMVRIREPVNGLSHLVAAIVSLVGLIALLVIGHANTGKEVSLLIYGVTLVLLFTASATYHLVSAKRRVTAVLRKLDHAAIYLLIAGTYTPFCYNMFSGFWRWGLLSIVWVLALTGIGIKMFVMGAPRWLNTAIYLVLGWLIIFGIQELLAVLPGGALILLLVGGILYTLGAVIYATKIPDFARAACWESAHERPRILPDYRGRRCAGLYSARH